MEFIRYGIHFKSLDQDDLEMVRNWRNQDVVRLQMDFQEPISKEKQLQWFEQLAPKNNAYFIASFEETSAALLHIKDINWKNSTGETGIFIGNASYRNTSYPLLAILALNDWAFFFFQLKTLWAKISDHNSYNQTFNRQLGFEKSNRTTSGHFSYYSLSRENFLQKAGQFRATAQRAYGSETQVYWSASADAGINNLIESLSPENHQLLQPTFNPGP